jgi:hypothetical protein
VKPRRWLGLLREDGVGSLPHAAGGWVESLTRGPGGALASLRSLDLFPSESRVWLVGARPRLTEKRRGDGGFVLLTVIGQRGSA